jgi:lysophospholipid acyltransferase (LPLAT)-like uncharacterized protein
MEPTEQAVPTETGKKSENASRSFSLRQRFSLWLISWTGYLFIRLIGPTLRYTIVPEPGCVSDGRTVPTSIWCFWHRCLIPVGYFFRGRQFAIMISQSFDGEYIARIVQKLGFRAVRGSSSRGAVGALLGMRQELEKGHVAAFTIDGPRGPRYVAKHGPIMLAKMTGCSVNAFYIAVERAWVLNSWDQMIIPKPFSRACAYGSSPLHVPANATESEMEALHQQLQAALERCREQAEQTLLASR